MKTFKVGDKVKINKHNAPKIHNKIAEIYEYDDTLEMFKIKLCNEFGTYLIKSCLLEKIENEEELTKKCLFENADALDTYIGTIDNMVCLSTISNDVSTWSVGTYKGNDCVMPSYARLKESEEKKMKEIKNQKVVDLYFKRKREEIDKRRKELRTEIIKADRNQVFIEELQKQYDEYCEANKEDLNFLSGRFDVKLPLTKESMSKDAENDTLYENEISHLKELKEEITAMLSGCETYEQEMEILQTYKIVNYNTHYVSMNKIDISETN